MDKDEYNLTLWIPNFGQARQVIARHAIDLESKAERTVIFYDPDPVLNFFKSVQVQPESKDLFKFKVQVQIQSKRFLSYCKNKN